ncbi:class I SAM-dependent methyltransferase [Octadecabacter sp. CECT 8868]|uniref:class I SAM-dependent DNA methyltransferase n=1 Tax=Octadecabacter algicola TaxID=2909342 RepID=UPI001F184BF7|nr:methyltransferase domain-containing protein [Octadecabacter algicola]MCF2905752.1 class I SAM-dependent methyltransferase [Octadecabacter algicola]
MSADKETLDVYNAKAADYEARFGGGHPSAHLDRFIHGVPKGGRVLDLGCGPASSAAHMAAAGLVVEAVDASAEMVRIAAQKDGITAKQAVFDDLNAVDHYDGIWANFSLLHAPRNALPRHFASIAAALKPRGMFFIGMKTGEGETRDHLGRRYTFVTLDELHGLMRDAGFEVLGFEEGQEAGMAGTVDPFVNMRAQKIA